MLVNVVSWFTRLFLHWRGVVGRGCPLGFDLWVDQGVLVVWVDGWSVNRVMEC